MAYNLQSLITILHPILDPQQTHWVFDHSKPQLESLLEKATSLQQLLEKSSLSTKLESLEGQITDAAYKAEDMIESHMVDQRLSSPEGVSFTFVTPYLQQVMQQLDSLMEQVVKLTDGKTMMSGTSPSGSSLLRDPSSKSVVVGVDEDVMKLKDWLTGVTRKLEIVPIIGMGGIGKTTLARKLYEDPLIVYHFDHCAWATISQDYNIQAILSGLLGYTIGKEANEFVELEKLYKSLYGRRYLIVLDDMWSTEAWDKMRKYFPDNNNGSRIVITTRETNVAEYSGSQSLQHRVQLLSKPESWNLLHQIVFGKEDCPLELQGIAEKIASDCGGLPLAINVIGGLLCKVERSRDVWEDIASDVRAAIADSDKQFSNILTLSYNHLPNNLKPCFLYMGAFPEDYEIKGSRLIRMWVAEGFLKSNGDKSSKEEAENCLKILIERNLLLVTRYKSNGKPMRYGIHDLLRDLCMKKANEKKFLYEMNGREVMFYNLRRVSVDINGMEDVYASTEFMSLARSFVCTRRSYDYHILSSAFFVLRLLRVLDLFEMELREFPTEIFQLVNLRYLAFYCKSNVPPGISKLWNLQTLITKGGSFYVSSEIWELSALTYLDMDYNWIWFEDEYMKKFVENKLEMIRWIQVTSSIIKKGLFESIPNIKNLGISCKDMFSSVIDLSHLHRLEILRCYPGFKRDDSFVSTLRFPCNLRKLTLSFCKMYPSFLTSLCALPNLEELCIRYCTFDSGGEYETWEVAQGDEFRSLQCLRLSYLQSKIWRADETNFPRLRHLFMEVCKMDIPPGIGEISTLQLIELRCCLRNVEASAEEIRDVQQYEYDNYDIKLIINHK